MKFVAIVVVALVGCASAQFGNFRGFQKPFVTTQRPYTEPPRQYQEQQYNQGPRGPFIAIRSQSSDAYPDGTYGYAYESDNGISVSESGSPKNTPEGPAETVRGSYSYTAPDGTPIRVDYYADETGFHAEGAHLPTPPPIPEAIAKSLAILPQLQDDSNNYDQGSRQQYNRPPAYNAGNGPFRRF